jgi:hypothetical protein
MTVKHIIEKLERIGEDGEFVSATFSAGLDQFPEVDLAIQACAGDFHNVTIRLDVDNK